MWGGRVWGKLEASARGVGLRGTRRLLPTPKRGPGRPTPPLLCGQGLSINVLFPKARTDALKGRKDQQEEPKPTFANPQVTRY